jgi:hypothetical protein
MRFQGWHRHVVGEPGQIERRDDHDSIAPQDGFKRSIAHVVI